MPSTGIIVAEVRRKWTSHAKEEIKSQAIQKSYEALHSGSSGSSGAEVKKKKKADMTNHLVEKNL